MQYYLKQCRDGHPPYLHSQKADQLTLIFQTLCAEDYPYCKPLKFFLSAMRKLDHVMQKNVLVCPNIYIFSLVYDAGININSIQQNDSSVLDCIQQFPLDYLSQKIDHLPEKHYIAIYLLHKMTQKGGKIVFSLESYLYHLCYISVTEKELGIVIAAVKKIVFLFQASVLKERNDFMCKLIFCLKHQFGSLKGVPYLSLIYNFITTEKYKHFYDHLQFTHGLLSDIFTPKQCTIFARNILTFGFSKNIVFFLHEIIDLLLQKTPSNDAAVALAQQIKPHLKLSKVQGIRDLQYLVNVLLLKQTQPIIRKDCENKQQKKPIAQYPILSKIQPLAQPICQPRQPLQQKEKQKISKEKISQPIDKLKKSSFLDKNGSQNMAKVQKKVVKTDKKVDKKIEKKEDKKDKEAGKLEADKSVNDEDRKELGSRKDQSPKQFKVQEEYSKWERAERLKVDEQMALKLSSVDSEQILTSSLLPEPHFDERQFRLIEEYRMLGIPNFGNTCYIGSAVMLLQNVEPFRRLVERGGAGPHTLRRDLRLMMGLLMERRIYQVELAQVSKAFMQKCFAKFGRVDQQDASEFMTWLIDTVGKELQSQKELDLLFKLKTESRYQCPESHGHTLQDQHLPVFMRLPQGPACVSEMLKEALQQPIEGLKCEACGKEQVLLTKEVVEAPETLLLVVNRFQFVQERRVKMMGRVALEERVEVGGQSYRLRGFVVHLVGS